MSGMTMRAFLTGFFLAGWAFGVSAETGSDVVFENAQVRFVFSREPVPGLRHLVHKHSGTELLDPSADPVWFSADVRNAKGGTTRILSGQAKQGNIALSKAADGVQHLTMTYSDWTAAPGLSVRITGRLEDGAPWALWQISVSSSAPCAVASIRFPVVAAVPSIGTPEDDVMVAPALPGTLIENPAAAWPKDYSAGWSFPGEQSVQFFAYQDKTAGIYLSSQDTVGYGRALQAARQAGKRFILSQEYKLSDAAFTDWQSPYGVALGVTQGSWQDSADLYKRWTERQIWCAQKLAQREDVSEFWKRGPFILHLSLRRKGKDGLCTGSYYADLPDYLHHFRDRIGGTPVVPHLNGWENHRIWTAGDYFPIFDAKQAEPVLAQLKREGMPAFVFFSGLFYTFNNTGPDGSPVPGADRYMNAFVIDKKTGRPAVNVLNDQGGAWKRFSYSFCPSAAATPPFFRSALERLHAQGIDIVQMDQTVSAAGGVCSSTEHGHAPGPGAYQSIAFRKLLCDLRQYGRTLSPDFALAHEEPHENLIPCIDFYHTREFREGWWYHNRPGGRGIPLFTYLYHEYVLGYGGGPYAGPKKDPNAVREIAVDLIAGKIPSVVIHTQQFDLMEGAANRDALGIEAGQLAMICNHTGLLRTEAGRFLMQGRMLHSLAFDTPTVTVKNQWSKKGTFDTPAVLTSSWLSPEGRVGHCLVNITDVKQTVHLRLDTRNAPAWPNADIVRYSGTSAKGETLFRGTALPCDYPCELAPLEALFFVMRPAR